MEHFGVAEALAKMDAVRDILTVKRVFGEAYEANGVTVIPVASIRGGAGGGGGEDKERQVGGGAGFGVIARPVGVFVVDGERVRWEPALDVNRIVLGGQLAGAAALLVLARVLRRRKSRR